MSKPTTLTLRTKAHSVFLAQYKLERKVLLRSDRAAGIAGLRAGVDAESNPVLIKTWPRDPAIDDSDIRDIWRNELRQLYRLAGYPGVSDFIVELKTSGEDDLGFYLVLSPGQRRPLPSLDLARRHARSDQDRLLLWKNLRRIACGLEILHLQGLLHRNLSQWSILSSGGDEPDFQLTGFEWSMRLVAAEADNVVSRAPSSIQLGHSFTRDWQQFGQICAELLGVANAKLLNLAIPAYEVADALIANEVKLIRELLQVVASPRIDGRHVVERIDGIVTRLSIAAQRKEPRFTLVVALGQTGPLASPIREASNREIETNDLDGQREFIANDLSHSIAMSLKMPGQAEKFRLVVRGYKLTYFLDDFLVGPERASSNWEIAYCGRADPAAPLASFIIKQVPISADALSIVTRSELKGTRFRSRFASWEALRKQLQPIAEKALTERRLSKSLALGQMLEYMFAAADVFPVDIVSQTETDDADEGRVRLLLRVREDADREELSSSLGLKGSPAKRLEESLLGDKSDSEEDAPGSWILTDSALIGDKSPASTEWQFESVEQGPDGKPAYCFSGERIGAQIENAFLISDESVGRDSQLKRRMRSFRALAEHAELARMLSDPRARVMKSDDRVESNDHFATLDPSKQKAFTAVIETLPLFLVQGPPGVGKTRLVRELVRSKFSADRATRILLSAQSNSSVDHLLNEIEEIFEGSATLPLMIRCTPKDKKEEGNPFDIGQQSKVLLKGLLKSELFQKASTVAKERVAQLAEAYDIDVATEAVGARAANVSSARKAFEGLVLRSANLVFATTNSADLERLIEEKSQFDWVMVEEAGKATGGELVSPLLLSHRRLMIGDHKQLPPFNAERFLALLNSPNAVQRALRIADPMIGRAFRDATVDEVFTDADSDQVAEEEQSFADQCTEAGRTFSLFETVIEDEFERQKRRKSGIPIATALTVQHRMHPAIAELVSRMFYPQLTTDPARADAYRNSRCPIRSVNTARLPDAPIVWIDMPWVQSTVGKKYGDRRPAHTNPDEVRAVRQILQLLEPRVANGRKPSLAILSPYSRQVARLQYAINNVGPAFDRHLSDFAMPSKHNQYCATVDSFQGNEADCVLVSMVRNNGNASIFTALGFLADERRMNVLLSRARWRMIVVGSLEFLEAVNRNPKSEADARRIRFLERLISGLRSPSVAGDIAIVPLAALEKVGR